MAYEFEYLLVETEDRVAILRVNRPKQLNALNRKTLEELEQAALELKGDPEVGAVILTGEGDRSFVAGADINELAELTPGGGHAHALFGQRVLNRFEQLGKPVIAAINGFALGGGLELAMACSIRLASQGAVLGQPEVNLGLIPGFAGTQRLARLVGRGRALEMLLSGDHVGAEQAERMGLVNRVLPPEELLPEAIKLARRILSRGPVAVSLCLEAVNRGLEGSFAEGERLEAALFGLCFASEDMREGTRAFLEKRKPSFSGR